MTILEGDSGLIVIDPVTSIETAKAAIELYRQHRGTREVRAVFDRTDAGDPGQDRNPCDRRY
ncbi:MBL fold metallo-hydrolase [Pseudoprimorskyibacter insulae]|uniref:MBL fold metallo-hydrolase n=1 Tax=Pseudoprimorskyibacter insulae TaxID=1695997 RepID=UPI001C62CD7A|nr:MBL fold metallo-hydrolase [Pseudoprimorskyibacter insulae]